MKKIKTLNEYKKLLEQEVNDPFVDSFGDSGSSDESTDNDVFSNSDDNKFNFIFLDEGELISRTDNNSYIKRYTKYSITKKELQEFAKNVLKDESKYEDLLETFEEHKNIYSNKDELLKLKRYVKIGSYGNIIGTEDIVFSDNKPMTDDMNLVFIDIKK